MLKVNNNHTSKLRNSRNSVHNPDGINFFHFDLSEKDHEVVLPVEEETAWEKLREIVWDPARGD